MFLLFVERINYLLKKQFFNMENQQYHLIDKSQVYGIKYLKHDVLESPQDKEARKSALHKALTLGNLHKQHVRIRFKNANNQMLETKATIWALTENYVVLKSHMMIPIQSIMNVRIL